MNAFLRPVVLAFSLLAIAGIPGHAGSGPAGVHVTLECSANAYPPADSVLAIWTNDTDSTLVAGNHPPYTIYDAETGDMVCQYGLPWEFRLGPHSWVLLSWDQRDCENHLVPPGRYIMRIWYVFNDVLPEFVVEDGFEILDPASAPDDAPVSRNTTWGRLKSVFR